MLRFQVMRRPFHDYRKMAVASHHESFWTGLSLHPFSPTRCRFQHAPPCGEIAVAPKYLARDILALLVLSLICISSAILHIFADSYILQAPHHHETILMNRSWLYIASPGHTLWAQQCLYHVDRVISSMANIWTWCWYTNDGVLKQHTEREKKVDP